MPFRPGQSGNPLGRPRGARDKLGAAFLQALADDFQAHGTKVIAKVRRDHPHDYLKIIATSIPKQVDGVEWSSRSPDQLSDEELTAIIVGGLSDKQLKAVIEMGRDDAEGPDAGQVVDGEFNARLIPVRAGRLRPPQGSERG